MRTTAFYINEQKGRYDIVHPSTTEMSLLINLLPFRTLIWWRVRHIVLELHNLASIAKCHIPQYRIKWLPSKLKPKLSRHGRMSLSRPAEPWSCPIKPGLLLRHSGRYPCTQFRRSALAGSVSIFIFPPAQPPTSNLQPRTSIPILTHSLYCHRLVDQDQNCTAESCLGAWVPLSGQTPPSGTTFQPDQSRSFSQNPYCTSHDSAASTRRGPSTCSSSHQGPADRAVKAGKMLPSLAGRTPRLGKRRPWSRNQAGKGGVGLSLPHTRGGPRPESIVDGGTCERVSHCLHATQKWHHRPASHLVVACFSSRHLTAMPPKYNPLRRETAPGRDLLHRPTSMLTKHKS